MDVKSHYKLMSGDQLTMGYFDNLDNGPLNKYKKNYTCVFLPLDWWSFKFHAISLSFDSLSNTVKLEPL
jgi:hypothetical protein